MVPPKSRFSVKAYVGKKQPKQSIHFLNVDPFDLLLHNSNSNSNIFCSSSENAGSASESKGLINSEVQSSYGSIDSSSCSLRNLQGSCSNKFKKSFCSRSTKKKYMSDTKINRITNEFRKMELDNDSIIFKVTSSTPNTKTNLYRNKFNLNIEIGSNLSPIDKSNLVLDTGQNSSDKNRTPSLSDVEMEKPNNQSSSVLEFSLNKIVKSLSESPCTPKSKRTSWKDSHYLHKENVLSESYSKEQDAESSELANVLPTKPMSVAQMFRAQLRTFIYEGGDSLEETTASDNSSTPNESNISREYSGSLNRSTNMVLSNKDSTSEITGWSEDSRTRVSQHTCYYESAKNSCDCLRQTVDLPQDLTQLSLSLPTPQRITVTRGKNLHQCQYSSLDSIQNSSHLGKNDAERRKIYQKLSKSLPAWFKDSTPLAYDRMYDIDPRRSRKTLARMKDELPYSSLTSSTKSLPAVLEDQNLEQINDEELHSPRVSFKKSNLDHSTLNSSLFLGFSNSDIVKRRAFVKKHSEDSSCTSPHTLPVLPEDESDSSSCEDESKRFESGSSSVLGSPLMSPGVQGSPIRPDSSRTVSTKNSISYITDGTSELSLSSRSEGLTSPVQDDLGNVVSPRASSPEPSAASSEEDSGSSPIRRDEQRRRRPSRLSSKRTLGYIAEEAESDASELSNLPKINNDGFVLMPGKKCRRSLAIIRNHLSKNVNEETICLKNKGRNYLESIEVVKQLQKGNMADSLFLDSDDSSDMSPDPRRSMLSRSSLSTFTSSRFTTSLTYDDLSDSSPDYRPSLYTCPTRLPRKSICLLNSEPVDITVVCSQIGNNYARESLLTASPSYNTLSPYQAAILHLSDQDRIIEFPQVFADDSLSTWKKIGEGVYSEVFSLHRNGQTSTVLKVIPVDGSTMVNGGPQKTLEENITEILISKYLSELSVVDNVCDGFVRLAKVWFLQGSYPIELIKLWEDFNELSGSDNDHPTIFPTDQLYLGLELVNSGKALESYRFATAKQSFSILQQVVLSLALAEEIYEFEHRDLHWGNILVDRTKQKVINYNLKGQEYRVATNGLKSTIIDYTWSSITYNRMENGTNIRMVTDMEQDPDLFTGKGDLQFDIYRNMRNDVDKDWSKYNPKTNVRWIYYLTDKLVHSATYYRQSTQTHKVGIDAMNKLLKDILLCDNSLQVAVKMQDYM